MRKMTIASFMVFCILFCFLNTIHVLAVEKDKYLVLVYRRSDKNLVMSTYVEERKGKYDIRMFCLEDENVPNNQDAIRKFLQKTYKGFSFSQAVFLDDIRFADRVRYFDKATQTWKEILGTNDCFYSKLTDDKEWHTEFVLGRIFKSNLQKIWIKANSDKIGLLGPYETGPRRLFCPDPSCEPTPVEDPSLFGQEIKDIVNSSGLELTTFYDSRNKSLELKNKPDFVLSKEILKEQQIENFPCLISWTTREPYNPFDKRPYYESYPRYSTVKTYVWDDKDKNGAIDNYNAELEIEEAYDFSNPQNIKKIGIIQVTDRTKYSIIASQFYAAFMDLDNEDPRYWNYFLKRITESLFAGHTIGEAGSKGAFTTIIFGPPETVLSDVISRPKIFLKSNVQDTEELSEIVIYGNKTSFFISNIGDNNLTYKIIVPDRLDITPTEGTIPPYTNIEILVYIKKAILPFGMPHKKNAVIVIESNDSNCPRKEIKIKWLSATLQE